jgi:hypothetical protein
MTPGKGVPLVPDVPLVPGVPVVPIGGSVEPERYNENIL